MRKETAFMRKLSQALCPPLGFKETNEHVGNNILSFIFLRQIDMSQ